MWIFNEAQRRIPPVRQGIVGVIDIGHEAGFGTADFSAGRRAAACRAGILSCFRGLRLAWPVCPDVPGE